MEVKTKAFAPRERVSVKKSPTPSQKQRKAEGRMNGGSSRRPMTRSKRSYTDPTGRGRDGFDPNMHEIMLRNSKRDSKERKSIVLDAIGPMLSDAIAKPGGGHLSDDDEPLMKPS